MTKQESFAVANRQIEHVSFKQHQRVGHTLIAGIYSQSIFSRCKNDGKVQRSSEVLNRKYKVYNAAGQVVKDTDDIAAARRAEKRFDGAIYVRGNDGRYR